MCASVRSSSWQMAKASGVAVIIGTAINVCTPLVSYQDPPRGARVFTYVGCTVCTPPRALHRRAHTRRHRRSAANKKNSNPARITRQRQQRSADQRGDLVLGVRNEPASLHVRCSSKSLDHAGGVVCAYHGDVGCLRPCDGLQEHGDPRPWPAREVILHPLIIAHALRGPTACSC